jgi:hypothetical protein
LHPAALVALHPLLELMVAILFFQPLPLMAVAVAVATATFPEKMVDLAAALGLLAVLVLVEMAIHHQPILRKVTTAATILLALPTMALAGVVEQGRMVLMEPLLAVVTAEMELQPR